MQKNYFQYLTLILFDRVNIIMDTFASLALSTEPPNDKLLDRNPIFREDSIVTPNMWRNIFG